MQNATMNDETIAAIATAVAQAVTAALTSTTAPVAVETTAKTRKAPKPKPSARVANAAIKAAAAAGFECKAYKRGTWTWLYDVNAPKGNRTSEFQALKLAKGWKFSPKRGQFYRVD